MVQAVKLSIAINPKYYNFTSAANHLSAQIKLAKSRALGAVGTGPGRDEITRNGKIFTGYYKNWSSISPENKKLVLAERKRLGIEPKRQGSHGGSGSGNVKKQIKALAQRLDNFNAKVSASSRQGSADEDDSDAASGSDLPTNDAGNSFGGHAEKAKQKQAKKQKKD